MISVANVIRITKNLGLSPVLKGRLYLSLINQKIFNFLRKESHTYREAEVLWTNYLRSI